MQLSHENPSALGPWHLQGIFTCARPECTIHTTCTFLLTRPFIHIRVSTHASLGAHLCGPLSRPDHRADLLHKCRCPMPDGDVRCLVQYNNIAINWRIFCEFPTPILSLFIEISVVKILKSNFKCSIQHKFDKLRKFSYKILLCIFGFLHLILEPFFRIPFVCYHFL